MLTLFNTKYLFMPKKSHTFANDYEEPTALAFTDFSKPTPILEGEDAERFISIMEENERKAKERENQPMTKDEAEKLLSYNKIIREFELNRLKEIDKEIKKLEKK